MNDLKYFFEPKSCVMIGASETEGSVGRAITLNLLKAKDHRQIYLVNPKRQTIFNHPCLNNLSDLPDGVELAVIATPASTVMGVIKELSIKKVKTCVIISAGFKELGPEGEKLERDVIEHARRHGIRVIGPNCLGVMNPHTHLNATFASSLAPKGKLAFISQSGAICTSVLDYSIKNDIGFSGFISIGSMADVEFADLIEYYGHDRDTSAILLYMETIGDTKKFLKAAKEVCKIKPVIVLKAGKTEAAAKAAASHTGSLAGSDAIFNAAIEEMGILRARNISDLFNFAQVLDYQPLPEGHRLTLLTNAGGPGVLATDSLILSGGELAPCDSDTIEQLNKILPQAWSHANPIDLLGDAGALRYKQALDIAIKQKDSDGVLVVLTPQDMTDPLGTAQSMIEAKKHTKKPLWASFMGAGFVEEGAQALKAHKIPNITFPDLACETFSLLATNREYVKSLSTQSHKDLISHEQVSKIQSFLKTIQQEKRSLLTEVEAKHLLDLAGIEATKMLFAKSSGEAVKAANKISYPVVLKLHSHTITHKSDVGGVKLNLHNEHDVIQAFDQIQNAVRQKDFEGVSIQPMIKPGGFEIILGSSTDPQFGPVMLAGLGGELVEIFKDTALAIPPLSAQQAEKLLQKTKIYTALLGYRGKKAVDLEALFVIMAKFSELIYKVPQIVESDINPLRVTSSQIIALDARFVIT